MSICLKTHTVVLHKLEKQGIQPSEISLSSPAITDKSAQRYGNSAPAEFRYTAVQTVTVYSKNIEVVRDVMGKMSDLGKHAFDFVLNVNALQAESVRQARVQASRLVSKMLVRSLP